MQGQGFNVSNLAGVRMGGTAMLNGEPFPIGVVRGVAAGNGLVAPDHLSVSGAVNLLSNDMRQLLEEIGELRERLSPLLAERKALVQEGQTGLPANCKLAAELNDIESIVQNAREIVAITMSQLDL